MLRIFKIALPLFLGLISCGSHNKSEAPTTDTVAEIISQLHLCDTATNIPICVDNYRSHIINLKTSIDYSAFLYQTIDGSSKDIPAIKIYLRREKEYEFIQGIDGFLDTLPGSLTSGFYDIRIRQTVEKDTAVVWESILYKWNGKNYEEQ